MRVSKSRTGAAIVAIAAAISAVGVSACGSSGGSGGTGGGGGGGGGGDPVARAASVSNSAGGYKMSFTLSVNEAPTITSAGNAQPPIKLAQTTGYNRTRTRALRTRCGAYSVAE